MTNKEIKTFSNMSMLLTKIKIKNTYSEEDYFNIFQLVDGYTQLNKSFKKREVIDELLNKKINDKKIIDLLRLVRNRYSHIDKHDAVEAYVILQTSVEKEDIHNIVQEIKNGIDDIFVKKLNSDTCKVIANTKDFIESWVILRHVVNNTKSENIYEEESREILRPFINSFNIENLNKETYPKSDEELIKLYKSEKMKKALISLHGKEIYDEIIKMMTDDNYTYNDAQNLMLEIMKQIKEKAK